MRQVSYYEAFIMGYLFAEHNVSVGQYDATTESSATAGAILPVLFAAAVSAAEIANTCITIEFGAIKLTP